MDFAERVRCKIKARRRAYWKSVDDGAEADDRLRVRLEPLRAAVVSMIDDLSDVPLFTTAMGRPEVIIMRSDENGREGILYFKGPAGIVSFSLYESRRVGVTIDPLPCSISALHCDRSYGDGTNLCDLSKIADLLDRARDHLSDFLADISLSSEARPST